MTFEEEYKRLVELSDKMDRAVKLVRYPPPFDYYKVEMYTVEHGIVFTGSSAKDPISAIQEAMDHLRFGPPLDPPEVKCSVCDRFTETFYKVAEEYVCCKCYGDLLENKGG